MDHRTTLVTVYLSPLSSIQPCSSLDLEVLDPLPHLPPSKVLLQFLPLNQTPMDRICMANNTHLPLTMNPVTNTTTNSTNTAMLKPERIICLRVIIANSYMVRAKACRDSWVLARALDHLQVPQSANARLVVLQKQHISHMHPTLLPRTLVLALAASALVKEVLASLLRLGQAHNKARAHSMEETGLVPRLLPDRRVNSLNNTNLRAKDPRLAILKARRMETSILISQGNSSSTGNDPLL